MLVPFKEQRAFEIYFLPGNGSIGRNSPALIRYGTHKETVK
jgi:hypothetical protein